MPSVTLVVCVHRQRDLLERLIRESAGCYDVLIVLHDIPDIQNVREVTLAAGGRFFEREPIFLQEPHWPFAWGEAKHDWILRLDTDEFPSPELKKWLQEFRRAPEPASEISGYFCIWPMWDGQRAISKKWPANRLFLFHKQRVRFFGMCEQSPVPDGQCKALDLVLCHQPKRKSYGIYNTVFRRQSQLGAKYIAHCLLGKPTDLVCWRWSNPQWPVQWEQIRRHPILTAANRLLMETLRGIRDQWRKERKIYPFIALNGPIYHALFALQFWWLRTFKHNDSTPPE
jgi:hypothetical protein